MAEKNFTELYNDQDLKVLKVAEDSLNPRLTGSMRSSPMPMRQK